MALTGKRARFDEVEEIYLNQLVDVLSVNETNSITLSGTSLISNIPCSLGDVNLLTGQLKFPGTQNASTEPNTLDDYEEGSWFPTVFFDNMGSSVISNSGFGRYIKVGRMVTAYGLISASVTKGTASGLFRLSGLPFTVVNLVSDVFPGSIYTGSLVVKPSGVLGQINTTLAYFAKDINSDVMQASDIGTGTVSFLGRCQLTYFTQN